MENSGSYYPSAAYFLRKRDVDVVLTLLYQSGCSMKWQHGFLNEDPNLSSYINSKIASIQSRPRLSAVFGAYCGTYRALSLPRATSNNTSSLIKSPDDVIYDPILHLKYYRDYRNRPVECWREQLELGASFFKKNISCLPIPFKNGILPTGVFDWNGVKSATRVGSTKDLRITYHYGEAPNGMINDLISVRLWFGDSEDNGITVTTPIEQQLLLEYQLSFSGSSCDIASSFQTPYFQVYLAQQLTQFFIPLPELAKTILLPVVLDSPLKV